MSDDKPEKRGFAIFDRRHSANAMRVRRSVSSVGFFSSRRNSTPTPQAPINGVTSSATLTSTTTTSPANNVGAANVENNYPLGGPPMSGKRHIRAEKWQILARKVLGNLEEEDLEVSPGSGNLNE